MSSATASTINPVSMATTVRKAISLVVFFIANQRTRMQSDNETRVFDEMAKKGLTVGSPLSKELISIKKVRHVEESSGGGSSGGGSSGGGGGGGGSSGGGGGHGF